MTKTTEYTVQQAAIKSGIPEDEIITGILAGEIPAQRDNGQFAIPQSKVKAIPAIVEALRPLYKEPKQRTGDNQYWVWHEGEYTSVFAQSKEQAVKKFRANPANKGKNPYTVWCVTFGL